MEQRVRFFVSGNDPVNEGTRRTLEAMSEAEGVVLPIVALPDLHFKHSYNTPTGVVVLTRNTIIPKFVNANCGMSFIKTPFFAKDMDEKRLDRVFGILRERISVSTRMTPLISKEDLEGIALKGAEWAFEKYRLNGADLLNFENEGSIFKNSGRTAKEIMSCVPAVSRNMGRLSLGVLGYGNHFIELQAVGAVKDKDIAEKFGVSEGQLCFMTHGDSRAFGQSLLDHYSKGAKRLLGLQQAYKNLHYAALASDSVPLPVKSSLDRVNYHLNRIKSVVYWKMEGRSGKENASYPAFSPESEEGRAYLMSTYAALNFGYANRSYFAAVIKDALTEVFGKKYADVRILHDGNHDSLQKENIGGEEYYVHRNGAARAVPAEYSAGHPIFSETGRPVLLPSALGRPSFLLAASKGSRLTHYSACHGTGRLIERGEARGAFKAEDVLSEARAAKMKIYDYGKGEIQEEAPRAFKDAGAVLKILTANDIARPVAELRPVASLKGWR